MSFMKVGEKYNWKNQPERLVYLGLCEPRNGRWHQFAKVESPTEVWCEVLAEDLHRLEATQPTGRTYTTQPGESIVGIAGRELGDQSKWAEIRLLNADRFPNICSFEYYPVGTVLKMPPKESKS